MYNLKNKTAAIIPSEGANMLRIPINLCALKIANNAAASAKFDRVP